mgnify:CR=1 FL=1
MGGMEGVSVPPHCLEGEARRGSKINMTKFYNKQRYTEIRKKLRNNATNAEIILWKKIRNKQLYGYRFRRQFGIENYVVDFYCPSLRLVIEIDGFTHSEEKEIQYDLNRQRSLEDKGLRILRFQNSDIFNRLDEVLITIHRVCQELDEEKRSFTPSCSPPSKGGETK